MIIKTKPDAELRQSIAPWQKNWYSQVGGLVVCFVDIIVMLWLRFEPCAALLLDYAPSGGARRGKAGRQVGLYAV